MEAHAGKIETRGALILLRTVVSSILRYLILGPPVPVLAFFAWMTTSALSRRSDVFWPLAAPNDIVAVVLFAYALGGVQAAFVGAVDGLVLYKTGRSSLLAVVAAAAAAGFVALLTSNSTPPRDCNGTVCPSVFLVPLAVHVGAAIGVWLIVWLWKWYRAS